MSHDGSKRGRVVILTTHPIEYEAIRSHLKDLREETHPQGTIYERGTFITGKQYWEVGLVQIETGNAAAALEAERAIAYFEPNIVFFIGVAGGINSAAPGDVVVATKVYGYEAGQVQGTTFLPQPDVGKSSYRLIERAKAESRKQDWRNRVPDQIARLASSSQVFLGPIAAGEKVIGSTHSTTFKFLQASYNDTLAVEMEGQGILLAAHRNEQVQALVIRGIVRLADHQHPYEHRNSWRIAAHHASAFALEILAKLDGPSAVPSQTPEDLRLVDLYVQENDDQHLLDITLQNTGTQTIILTRLKIDILDVGNFYYCNEDEIDFVRSFVISTYAYSVRFSPDDKGRCKDVKISHQLRPDETDRFQVKINQNLDAINLAYVWYYMKITILSNEQKHPLESTPFLLSVPPVDTDINNIWQPITSSIAQQNTRTLHRMAALTGKRSESVALAIQRLQSDH